MSSQLSDATCTLRPKGHARRPTSKSHSFTHRLAAGTENSRVGEAFFDLCFKSERERRRSKRRESGEGGWGWRGGGREQERDGDRDREIDR